MFQKVNYFVIKSALACAPSLAGCVVASEDTPSLDAVEQASICGTTDESQPVNFYDGSFERFPESFVNARKGPVGAMESTNSSSSTVKYCSGTLISRNLFLTAGHCVRSSTVGDFVAFNYEIGFLSPAFPFLVGVLPQTHALITEIVEQELGGVDYALLRLAGSPGDTFGFTPTATADAAAGAPIAMIGHPAGEPKQVEAGTVNTFDGDFVTYFNLDTQGGSSGSGILDSAGRIVGVHTNGGCTATGGANRGVRIARIRAVSSVL
jgi:V8-like Glu-specific endopeptidase